MPKVFIIIVTWNSEKFIAPLFLSLHGMDYRREDWQVVVVDNNSSDNTLNVLEEWQKKMLNFPTIIRNKKNLGFSGGNNQGIEWALKNGADYVVLLNDDVIVEPQWLKIVIDRMDKDKKIGLAQPLLTRYPETQRLNNFGNFYQYCGFGYSNGEGERRSDFFQKTKLEDYEPAYLSFSAVVIRADVFKMAGLMDELYFMYHEDSDFCFRARLQGWRLLAVKNAIVHHNYKFPAKKNKIRYFWLEKNRLYLMLKFFEWKTLILIFPACVAMEAGLIIFSIVRGFFAERCRAHLWVWRNLGKILAKRKEIQKTRKFSDEKLFEFMSPTIEFQEIKNPLLDKIGNPILKWYWGIIKDKIK